MDFDIEKNEKARKFSQHFKDTILIDLNHHIFPNDLSIIIWSYLVCECGYFYKILKMEIETGFGRSTKKDLVRTSYFHAHVFDLDFNNQDIISLVHRDFYNTNEVNGGLQSAKYEQPYDFHCLSYVCSKFETLDEDQIGIECIPARCYLIDNDPSIRKISDENDPSIVTFYPSDEDDADLDESICRFRF